MELAAISIKFPTFNLNIHFYFQEILGRSFKKTIFAINLVFIKIEP